jgi:lipoyl(octanoyl) transferase
MNNLLINEDGLKERNNFFFLRLTGGGDITYHGPGQIVGYPIIDLDYFFYRHRKSIFALLEESVIQTLQEYGIKRRAFQWRNWGVAGNRKSPSRARKICAIGVRCSRWVTMHGFAFNVKY